MSASSVERPRAAVASMPIPMSTSMRQPNSAWPSGLDDSFIAGPSGTAMPSGPSGTPRAAGRRSSAYDAQGGGGRGRHASGASGMSMNSMTSMAESAKSTDGHHVSAMTLGGGIFRRHAAGDGDDGSEFDPDRSLGRLVGELGRVMAGNVSFTTYEGRKEGSGRRANDSSSHLDLHRHSHMSSPLPAPLRLFHPKCQRRTASIYRSHSPVRILCHPRPTRARLAVRTPPMILVGVLGNRQPDLPVWPSSYKRICALSTPLRRLARLRMAVVPLLAQTLASMAIQTVEGH